MRIRFLKVGPHVFIDEQIDVVGWAMSLLNGCGGR